MVLLDTHTLLWALQDNDRLSTDARRAIMMNERGVSIISLWEIAIKASLPKAQKRMNLRRPFSTIIDNCAEQEIEIIQINPKDCECMMDLPHIHEDPFDRMIIAQSMTNGFPLITKDETIWKYECINKIW